MIFSPTPMCDLIDCAFSNHIPFGLDNLRNVVFQEKLGTHANLYALTRGPAVATYSYVTTRCVACA